MPNQNFNIRLVMDLFSYILTQQNLFCTVCGVPRAAQLTHTCTLDAIQSVLFNPITNALYEFILRVIANNNLIQFTWIVLGVAF